MKRILAALAVLALLGAGGALLWLRTALGPPAADDGELSFRVERGAGLAQVADALEAAGLVRNARVFEGLARWRGLGGELRAGEYALSRQLPAGAVLDRIVAGAVRTHSVSVPEGFTAVLIARRLEQAGLADADAFLEVTRDDAFAAELGVEGDGLEGYLFPETYQLARGLSPREIARAMVGEFLAVWQELTPLVERRGLGMRELVTLASIVEKETGAAPERPLVAAVFLNRMERGMRLETDPTVIYGIPGFDGNLKRRHLEDASNPYNTYRIPGLPPGPIASPGEAALRAVLEPADVGYLYFVARGDGSHVFSNTYREHARAVDRFQRRRR